jgi:2-dehydro-3-deoxygalactonokinase
MPDIAFVAVDWGTTRFRAWSVDRYGAMIGERYSSQGMSTLKPGDFSAVLEAHLTHLGALPDVPVVICGMAGARQGWREAAYLSVPCKLEDLSAGATQFASGSRQIAIVPGIAQRIATIPDVMRSEETQVLGLISAVDKVATVCMPGTHTKWVHLKDHAIVGFHTSMTGDLFSAVKKHTILQYTLAGGAVDNTSHAFADAVRDAIAAPQTVLPSLFQLRAGSLLFGHDADAALSRLSGLLIGLDIAALQQSQQHATVQLVGGNALGAAYNSALGIAGFVVHEHDGDVLARAGLTQIGSKLWPSRLQVSPQRETA